MRTLAVHLRGCFIYTPFCWSISFPVVHIWYACCVCLMCVCAWGACTCVCMFLCVYMCGLVCLCAYVSVYVVCMCVYVVCVCVCVVCVCMCCVCVCMCCVCVCVVCVCVCVVCVCVMTQIVSHESRYPGMVKTLHSQLPLVKFIGLGKFLFTFSRLCFHCFERHGRICCMLL